MNRFQRGATTPSDTEDGRLHLEQDAPHRHDNEDIDIEELKKRLTKAQERKMRRELELEQTKRELQECAEQAKTLFGVQSLEELEAFVIQAEQEDRKNMEIFMTQLLEEERRLDNIDERLKDLERNA